jgi:predicted DsbA family dithiol-disulfide isomerase
VRLAHSLALVSAQIRADMVEAIEFPHLAEKYHVQGVPRTVINEDTSVEGAVPEPIFVAKVLQALGMMTEAEVQKMVEDAVAATKKG